MMSAVSIPTTKGLFLQEIRLENGFWLDLLERKDSWESDEGNEGVDLTGERQVDRC